jgi:hypothetical protein
MLATTGRFIRVKIALFVLLMVLFGLAGHGHSSPACALNFFIDGELVGKKVAGDIGQCWALDEFILLFTNNSFETAPGYLNALLFLVAPYLIRKLRYWLGVATVGV